jgi:hypothetical protein
LIHVPENSSVTIETHWSLLDAILLQQGSKQRKDFGN